MREIGRTFAAESTESKTAARKAQMCGDDDLARCHEHEQQRLMRVARHWERRAEKTETTISPRRKP
jgi:hypothetical protein